MSSNRGTRNGLGPGLGGRGTGSTGRLPSFKGKRDLSLGQAKGPGTAGGGGTADKKKFTPNLNVQRKSKEVPGPSSAAGSSPGIGDASQVRGGRGRGRAEARGGRGGRPDFKARSRPELIQTMGSVFSDGISVEGIKRRSGGFGGQISEGERSQMARPVLPARGSGSQYDKEAEEKRLKALLQDDFIADLSCEGLYVPVQLPMIDTGKVFKADVKAEPDLGDEDEIQARPGPRKNRILDSDEDDEDIEDGSKTTSKLKPVSALEAKSVIVSKKDEPLADLTFPDLVRKQNGDLLFIQLPDHLPGSLIVKKEKSGDSKEGVTAAEMEGPFDSDGSKTSKCTLNDLAEGYIGKIQVRKSGKTQLKLGHDLLDVELGTQVGFLQDLVSIKTTTNPREVGDMTVLGHVKNRVVFTPNWDHLFSSFSEQTQPDGDSSSENGDS
ncbi:hypothetical protein TCAL_00786 [Tigriopus californicus]|uniref:DNA-directed RNA polymerase III subunit RPC4 n=1 Tax=Tigriopus californicus TaxID=6832 RepID=A0A553NF55_TIGCA|nr:DNA-directed RNA polymerase III subunit RPC4-like [Tigriopus californicus]TRY64009.1 hypothetical protein TCAL_00786 [Tigriopus californicus]|eukprot:TCALIF_00786-PA protein Name:"Similar to POLR3D DNA-directed RNA polymerase III subunit RPC4 (Bos taurus)" AED:0.02 eAED:0.04 QI:0/-1/0/1/-1/1/1/0/437